MLVELAREQRHVQDRGEPLFEGAPFLCLGAGYAQRFLREQAAERDGRHSCGKHREHRKDDA